MLQAKVLVNSFTLFDVYNYATWDELWSFQIRGIELVPVRDWWWSTICNLKELWSIALGPGKLLWSYWEGSEASGRKMQKAERDQFWGIVKMWLVMLFPRLDFQGHYDSPFLSSQWSRKGTLLASWMPCLLVFWKSSAKVWNIRCLCFQSYFFEIF